MVRNAFELDDAEIRIGDSYALCEHPQLERVVLTGEAEMGEIDREALGPTARGVVDRAGVTHAVWVPVRIEGRVAGVLSVSTRGLPLTEQSLVTCISIGDMVELALAVSASREQLKALATTDGLTGLLNWRGFDELATHRGRSTRFAVLSIDVDGLKQVNDTRGHAAGDQLLMTVAKALRLVIRSSDVVARLGGDEFAALLFDADEVDAAMVVRRVLHLLPGNVDPVGEPRLSVGVATGVGTERVADVLCNADAGMYRAKRRGGNGLEVAEGIICSTVVRTGSSMRTARPGSTPRPHA